MWWNFHLIYTFAEVRGQKRQKKSKMLKDCINLHKLLLWKTKTLLLLIYLYQTIIQALLSTADLPLRFLYCLLNSVALWGGPMVGTEGKSFEIKACRSLENAFLLKFSWNFKVSWGILKKSWLGRYIPFCMFVICNQKNKNNRRKVWKIYRVFQKQQKKNMKRLSFITQFKTEFLLPFVEKL